jgi:hypothetical protein
VWEESVCVCVCVSVCVCVCVCVCVHSATVCTFTVGRLTLGLRQLQLLCRWLADPVGILGLLRGVGAFGHSPRERRGDVAARIVALN